MNSRTERHQRNLRREHRDGPVARFVLNGADSPKVARVLAAVEADREREAARTATLIAAARRRLASTPIPERSPEPDEAA